MNIEHLKLFTRIAATNNISQAGQELGLSPAVASAHISKLEAGLGVRLVHRTTRKVSLTEEGIDFLPHAEHVLESVEAARSSVGTGNTNPQGKLRITAPASFGRMHLLPALSEFMQRYPEISVDLQLTDSIVDLVEGGFDIAIRNAELKDSSLVARKLAADKRILCASPDYLNKYGIPKSPEDLLNHKCITLKGAETWVFNTQEGSKSIKVKSTLRADHGEAIRDASVHGLGITISAQWCAYQELKRGDLVPILQDYPLKSNTSIWIVYPSSRLLAPKVRAFVDFFADYYGDPTYWESACNTLCAT